MSLRRIIRNRRAVAASITAALMAATAAVMSLVFSAAPAAATSNAADKMVVQGTNGLALCSTSIPVSESIQGSCNEGPTSLLQGSIKLSSPKNLVVDVTMDCSTVTDVSTTTTSSNSTKSTSSAEAAAGVHAWLTLTPTQPTSWSPSLEPYIIPVDPGGVTNSGQANKGDVTFCNRDLFLSQSLTNNNAGAITLATTLNIESQSANGFNWVSLPDANTTQVEYVTLWGETQNSCTSDSTSSTSGFTACSGSFSGSSGSTAGATSWVGQRTMILTPANTAQNAQF
jgi:hypothetical protein